MAKRVNEGISVNTGEMLAIMLAFQWAEEAKKMLIKNINNDLLRLQFFIGYFAVQSFGKVEKTF